MCKNILRQVLVRTFTQSIKSRRIPQQKRPKSNMDENIYDQNRGWIDSNSTDRSQNMAKTTKYKLMSYNILAQDLLIEHLHLYLKIDQSLLRWDKRLSNLQQEIVKFDPDILCLQEMQFDHLHQLVNKIRGKKRLEYVFKKKTGFRTDGCAIIYNKDKFQLIDDRVVEYYTENIPLLNRENIALLAKFKLKQESEKQMVIATTHLLYNPRREDVRSAQVGKLLSVINEFAKNEFESKQLLPVVLTGDFNFEADSSSFALLTANSGDTQKKVDSATVSRRKEQDLQMTSLDFGLYTASTFQERWIKVDHIFSSLRNKKKRIKVWRRYELPALVDCQRVGVIPNQFLGSDHYSLGILFSVD